MAKLVNKLEDKFGLDRIVFFSDAVIAIAITLLVIEIKVPKIESQLVNSELVHLILEKWPEYLGYIVSFMVISSYWAAHHRIFRYIKDYNPRLMYINSLFLMFIAFMPFVTWLLFSYPAQLITVIMYAGIVILIGIAILSIWLYAVRKKFIHDSVKTSEIKAITLNLLMAPMVFGVSIIIALFNPFIAMISWTMLIPLFTLSGKNT